jgi:hypothetical protein
VVGASVEAFFFLLIMDTFALHLASVVAGAPCIRFRCPHVQVEAQIMPLLSSLPASHSMAGHLEDPHVFGSLLGSTCQFDIVRSFFYLI